MAPNRNDAVDARRDALVRRGTWLNNLTIAYMSFEAVASLIIGLLAGSVALVGFGFDSVIELGASAAARWRLRADRDRERRTRAEQVTRRLIGWSFLLLAAYIAADAVRSLTQHGEPQGTVAGIAVLTLSAILMPILSRKKREVARALESRALESEATQTSLCAYLSAIALVGVVFNTTLGWWWADPGAAFVMVPLIVKEGIEGVRFVPTAQRSAVGDGSA